jgi:hypothetical protein
MLGSPGTSERILISRRLRSTPAALPFATVEPRLDGIDHHRRECDFPIERMLADALVKLDGEVNRGLAEALTVLGAYARLFFGSAAARTVGLRMRRSRSCRRSKGSPRPSM